MTGGLMQLVAYGAQDIYLTGNPMITYFKVVYRRHTNFAMESIQQTFNGTADFGQRVSALISRNGDLVSGMVLEAVLPALPPGDGEEGDRDHEHRWIDNVGHYLINSVSVEIGGQQIDEHFGDWLEIWYQLTIPAGHQLGYLKMIGQDPKDGIGQPTGLQNPGSTKSLAGGRKLYVPLQFWFCRNVGLALPLIALQYHEVKINILFSAASALYNDHGDFDDTEPLTAGLTNTSLWVDYIYLDTDERRRFAQVSHEYLIEQLQVSSGTSYTSSGSGSVAVAANLNFNHPVKELLWICKPTVINGVTVLNQPNNYTTVAADTGDVPIANIIPAITHRIITNDVDTTDVANHSHSLPSNTGNVNLGGGDHSHTIGGNTGAAGGHNHSYRKLTGITTIFDYGNFEDELGENKHTFTYDEADLGVSGANEVTVEEESNAIALASVTSAHNYTAPVTATAEGINPVVSAVLQLNGQQRFASRDGTYFNYVQCKAHHTNIPASPGLNVYSFALKPEDHQPSGSCNFSRIDNARLCLTLSYPSSEGANTNSGTVTVYAVNYNVLRIMSGMGGLAYSN